MTRTGAELARVVEANPYPVVDPTKVVVGFLADAVELADLELGDLSGYLPDELTVAGREVYVSVPNGQGRSKLMEALTKRRLTTTLHGAELANGDRARRAHVPPLTRRRQPRQ